MSSQIAAPDDNHAHELAAGTVSIAEGSLLKLPRATFSDVGISDSHVASVDWGDGNVENFSTDGIQNHRYTDGAATYTVVVETTNTSGVSSRIAELPVAVSNASPNILDVNAGSETQGEGDLWTLNADVFDPGDDTLTYTWDFGDGSSQQGVNLNTVEHAYADDGIYFATLTVDDADGGRVASTIPVAVSNVAPSINVTGAALAEEGSDYSLTLGEITDPGDDQVSQWVVDWGDDNRHRYTSAGTVAHRFADGLNDHTINASLVDEDGFYENIVQVPVEVKNVAPVIGSFGGDLTGDEVQRLSLAAVATDAAGNQDTLTYTWDFGDGSAPVTGRDLSPVFHTYADDGIYQVSLTMSDEDGGSASSSQNVAVKNVLPQASISGVPTAVETEPYQLRLGSVVDPGEDEVSQWIIDWGDGSKESFVDASVVSHTYADGELSTEISLTLVDEDGAHDRVATLPITVFNFAPKIDSMSGDAVGVEGDVLYFQATASDIAGAADPITMTWDFGDGTPPVSGDVVSHTFADNGTYVVRVTVSDEDGGSVYQELQSVVANVAPTIDVEGSTVAVEGEPYQLRLGDVSDPGDDTVSSWVIDWGDGRHDRFRRARLVIPG